MNYTSLSPFAPMFFQRQVSGRFILALFILDCLVGFRNKANLRVHVRHHSGDKATACPFCGAFLASNSKLFYHLLRKSIPTGSKYCPLL